MNVKERILKFISSKKIPISEFEKRCALSNGYISSMRKGFGVNKLEIVLNEFPELNREWLLYGEGSMLKADTPILVGSSLESLNAERYESEITALKQLLIEKDERIKDLKRIIELLERVN